MSHFRNLSTIFAIFVQHQSKHLLIAGTNMALKAIFSTVYRVGNTTE